MKACQQCTGLKIQVGMAKSDWLDARRKLRNAQAHDGDTAHYVQQVQQTRADLTDADASYADHRADCTLRAPNWSTKKVDIPTTEVRDRVAAGETVEDLATEYGCSAVTISRRLRAEGLTPTGRQAAPLPDSTGPLTAVPLFQPLPWATDALCAQTDPESFFPEKGGSTREAKAICRRCTVSAECLTYALDNEERFGIWGGFSERERRKLNNPTTQTA